MNYSPLYLRKNSERTVRNGHPWIFSGAVERRPKDADTGDIVDVFDSHERFVCRGFYNKRSLIRVRSLTQDANQPIDIAFFTERITQAVQLRRDTDLSAHTNAMRLVHGESDGLPGLIVDDYAGYLVIQIHTAGMEQQRQTILKALDAILTPKSIYERSDVGTRRAEGLNDRPTGLLAGAEPPEFIEIEECGVRLHADLYRGQKTGFFLDQRDNRFLLQRLAAGQSVLNLFSYSSGFSAHALKGGAAHTLDVDISPQVFPSARRNIEANRPATAHSNLLVADVFPFVDELADRGPRYDIVVCDPPSLLRKHNQLKQAMGVYTKLNRNAFRLVKDGGLLITASCSSRISQDDFFQIVRRAATGARVRTRILTYNLHPADHPVDPAFPDGRYLKCVFARVLR
ncbi:MAG: class I SAM-dependent rRNA methyltransferase [Candidatus Latescibacterota bacterium]|nr:class I SAM-dependent rRNA methyltransferase [Candidatus Latescibacterota bacterium]